jgi:butyryl-CoA dehydrogenase
MMIVIDGIEQEEQRQIREMVRAFTRDEIMPYASLWDEQGLFPIETFKKAAALGLAGIYIHPDVGGSGLTRVDAAIIFEELSRGCPSTAAYLSIHNMVCWVIDTYGDSTQRKQWLPDLLTMQHFASYCLTEPHSGSDAAALKTTAIKEGDHYVINGSKAFISGGGVSDVYLTMVRTPDNQISCLLIPKGTAGLHFGQKEKKLGWCNQPTTMVYFENCRVPCSYLIGEEGQGFKIALSALNGGRLNIAACSLGAGFQCLMHAKTYTTERYQFGHALKDFQTIQFKLANMWTKLHGARLMVYHAAAALDQHQPAVMAYCAMAKKTATDIGFEVCNDALQLYGGYGYLKDYPIERYVRDLRVHQILEGTNEIMQLVVARALLNEQNS